MTYSNNKSLTVTVASVFGVLMLVLMFQYIRVFTEAHSNGPLTAPIATPTEEPISAPIDTPVPTPTETPTPTSAPEEHHEDNNGGNNNGGESHNDNHESHECTGEKPKSAPVLLSWTKTGANQVTLRWSKVSGPVQYYVVSFGLKPHTPIYGNPHVGDGNTTSTVINGLSGSVSYYFTVEAANGCVHSATSNEVTVKINGAKLNQTIVGFKQSTTPVAKQNVLSSIKVQKKNATKPSQVQQPTAPTEQPKLPESKAPNGLIDSIHNFFKLIFN